MASYLGKSPARLAIVTDDTITSAKIVDNTVTSADILNATITGADLASDITINTTGTVTTSQVNLGDNERIVFGDAGEYMYGDGTNLQIVSSNALGIDTVNGIVLDSGSGGTTLKAGGGTTYGSLVNSSGDLIIKSGTTTALTFSGANVTAANDLTVTSDLAVDTNTLYVDSSNNRVGINDSSPSQALDVAGRARSVRFVSSTGGAAADAAFYLNDTNGLGIFSPAANTLAISTSASERLRIDSSGNVGIGTTSPAQLLHIYGGDILFQGATPILKFQPTSDTQQNKIDFALAAGTVQSSITGGGVDGQSLKFDTASSTRMTINSSGNVGIGTTSPQEELHIADSGDPRILLEDTSGDNQVAIRFKSANRCWIAGSYGGCSSFNISKADAFGTNDYFVVNNSGNVGIGTTSPSNQLHLYSDNTSPTPSLLIEQDGTGDAALSFKITDSANALSMGLNNSSGDQFIMSYNGTDVGAGTSAFSISSASRVGILKVATGSGNALFQVGDVASFDSNVGIGTTSPSAPLEITTTSTDDTILLTATEDSSSAAPVITLKRNSSSPADADYLGQIKFKGENDADQEVVYAKITSKIQDASDGSEDGLIEFALRKAGSNNIGARLRSDSLQLLNGTDLTVNTTTLHVDSSNSRVGIGTASPSRELTVYKASYPTIQLVDDTSGCNSGSCGTILQQHTGDGSFRIRNQSGCAIIIENGSNSCNLAVQTTGNVVVSCDLTIGGNLTVNGTCTTINTATLEVEDKTLCIAKGAADAAAANGAGIIVDGASACLTYGSTCDAWSFNKSLGIGTTSPTQDLDILNASGSNIVLRDTSSRALVMCGPATGVSPRIGTTGTSSSLIVTMNSNDCFVFTATGCLGVNTTNPLFGLHMCNGTIGFDDGSTTRHRIKSIGHQIGLGRCTLQAASADCGNLAFGSGALQCNDVGQYNVAMGYQALYNNNSAAGSYNTAHGYQALYNNTTGEKNTAVGYHSMYSNTTGEYNAAIGTDSLRANTIGQQNVALGHNSLYNNTEGFGQVAAGYKSLYNNTTGDYNVALGAYNLECNTSGSYNVGIGYSALKCNTTGNYNVAVGYNALCANTTGQPNVAIGFQAMFKNTIGDSNVAVGDQSMLCNTTGRFNTAVGYRTMHKNTTGQRNIAVGMNAMSANVTGCSNIAIGDGAMISSTAGNRNIAIGSTALGDANQGSFNVAVGYLSTWKNTTGCHNVSLGNNSLQNNTVGCYNVAIGQSALISNTTSCYNVAIGCAAMRDNTIGNSNVSIGYYSMRTNTTGQNNIALGNTSLFANTTGCSNVAIGYHALCKNTTGQNNIAIGTCAYCCGTTGINNIAIGNKAMSGYAGGGSCNTVLGIAAMQSPETCGSNNTALGFAAALKGASNTVAIGASALRNVGCTGCGSHTNVAMGGSAGCLLTKGCRNVFIGFTAAECSVHDTVGSSIDDNVAVGNAAMRCNINGHDQVAVGAFALTKGGSGSNVAVGANAGEQLSSLTSGGSYGNIAMGTNALKCAVTACFNVAVGWGALFAGDTTDTFNSQHNIAIGCHALRKNQTGGCSVAIGGSALLSNTIGCRNVAIGHASLALNTTGCFNTAIGYDSLYSNTVGLCNVSMGYHSLRNATTACQNIAIGYAALCKTEQNAQIAIGTCAAINNTTGSQNTVLGHFSFRDNTTGTFNIAIGNLALDSNTTGVNNVAIGYQANTSAVTAINVTAIGCRTLCNNLTSSHVGIGANALLANTTGISNIAIGVSSLSCNTTGGCNLAIGGTALRCNTTGCNSIAIGNQALEKQTTASNNVAVGGMAGACTTTGADNVIMGSRAMCANTIGCRNTAIGRESMRNHTTGTHNAALGYQSLCNSTIGEYNTALGSNTLASNTTGHSNTAVGRSALLSNTTGIYNTAVGKDSMLSNTVGTSNTAVGRQAACTLTTGSNNTVLGYNAQPSSATVSNEITLGDANVTLLRTAASIVPFTDDAQDLGSTSLQWRNIYTGDLHLNNESKINGNEFDGTRGNWTIQEGADDLFIKNNRTGKKYRFKLEEFE